MKNTRIPIKKILNIRIKCLIINPGNIAKELYKEVGFKSRYTYKEWFSNNSNIGLNSLLNNSFDLIIFDNTLDNSLDARDLHYINDYKILGGKVYNIISFYEYVTGRVPLVYYDKGWLVNEDFFEVTPRKHIEISKRIFDFAFSFLFLPIALVLASIGMFLIKLSSKGPVLFKQIRIGKNNKPFTIYKLRTMIYNPNGHLAHTTVNDNRIFPIGKFLRKSKIDELPQLINVLIGQMSLIGPRPERTDIVNKLTSENPYYPLRHIIRPGITGWAQVNDPTATPDQNLQKLEYDLYYIKNTTYFLELKILWRTLKVVLTFNSL